MWGDRAGSGEHRLQGGVALTIPAFLPERGVVLLLSRLDTPSCASCGPAGLGETSCHPILPADRQGPSGS